MEEPILFALTVLAILSTPGPTNTLLATAGAAVGIRRALPLVPAEGCGYLLSILTLGLVLGPLVAASPVLGMSLRILVGIYLLLLAWRLWRHGAALMTRRVALIGSRQVFFTTLLNPKAIIFALGIIPFGAPRPWLYLVAFLGLTAMVAVGWITVGAVMGRAATSRGHGRLVPRVGAAVVGGFALVLVASVLLR
jgi:threonine/homoserine/homoserine lactone efflux protein